MIWESRTVGVPNKTLMVLLGETHRAIFLVRAAQLLRLS
jgi:hypothetical protein